jgi:hypothetical protein
VTVGRKWKNEWISMEDAFNWLIRSRVEKWTVEELRSKLPHNAKVMDWKAAVHKATDFIQRHVITAPTMDVEPWRYAYTLKAWKLFTAIQDAGDEATAAREWEAK